jgi:glucose-1-phosphate adenylyltransferase
MCRVTAVKRGPHVLAMVLAGGEGKRLLPLTRDRAKPAVPFGGDYRLIDFALSNLVNSGYLRIVVLTQYKSHSLNTHLARTWRMSPLLGNYVTSVPAQMRTGRDWFAGSADAVYQNLNLIRDEQPDYICVFGADNLYRMDASQMVNAHIDSRAGVTVAALRVPIEEAFRFGVIEPGDDGRIRAFHEKPDEAHGLPYDPSQVYASMGNYVFSTTALVTAVIRDSQDPESRHDIGGNIIPAMVEAGQAEVYDFALNDVPGATDRDRGYWRDVGTLDAYYEANMDMRAIDPPLNLYNRNWPLRTASYSDPPAKFVFDEDGRRGQAIDSMLSGGCIVSGALVRHSLLFSNVWILEGSTVEDSLLLPDVRIGRNCRVRKAIIDEVVAAGGEARFPAGTLFGYGEGSFGVTDERADTGAYPNAVNAFDYFTAELQEELLALYEPYYEHFKAKGVRPFTDLTDSRLWWDEPGLLAGAWTNNDFLTDGFDLPDGEWREHISLVVPAYINQETFWRVLEHPLNVENNMVGLWVENQIPHRFYLLEGDVSKGAGMAIHPWDLGDGRSWEPLEPDSATNHPSIGKRWYFRFEVTSHRDMWQEEVTIERYRSEGAARAGFTDAAVVYKRGFHY